MEALDAEAEALGGAVAAFDPGEFAEQDDEF